MDTHFSIELLNYSLAFVEGLALILSPCILPILPIILAGSIEGGKSRSVGIICGFTLTFALFTLFSRVLVQHLALNLDLVRDIAFGLIALFGLVLISDYLSDKFSFLTHRLSTLGEGLVQQAPQGGFVGGVLLGCFVSLIWVPCGGPILAAAIVQTAVQNTSLKGFLTFFAFALGSIIPMLLIAYFGRKILLRYHFLQTQGHLIRKTVGYIILISAFFGAFVGYFAPYVIMPDAPNVVQKSVEMAKVAEEGKLKEGLKQPIQAPEIADISAWINSPPLKLADLKGKVILIDFWTYSCINCVRTLPYLKTLYDRYHDKGLVIIGVHTPEFEFEKDQENVKRAVDSYQIHYPIALDNNYGTWTAFQNAYWPAHYLIDKTGKIVYEHFGEGHYDETEYNILALLGMKVPSSANVIVNDNSLLMFEQSPETYFGYYRQEGFSDRESIGRDILKHYTYPPTLRMNEWGLDGQWTIQGEKIVSGGPHAGLKMHFFAKKVFVVMGTTGDQPRWVSVKLNDKEVGNGRLLVKTHGLYDVIDQTQARGGVIELIADEPGVEIYTFTFG